VQIFSSQKRKRMRPIRTVYSPQASKVIYKVIHYSPLPLRLAQCDIRMVLGFLQDSVAKCFRHYATNRKAVGSISDEVSVLFFYQFT
jgi:hypothetical protein